MADNARILIVDDNNKNLEVISLLFRAKGFTVTLAKDGESALKILETEKFDLILLDIMMPYMDGFEVCERIRENKKLDDIPIIFLTAKNEDTDILKGFEVGGQDYVTKPFESRELLARVNTQLELRQKKEALKTLNKVLEKKVDERTQELKKANEKLLLLDKAKIDFLSIISHEIRTPLNGIKGFSELLQFMNKSEELRTHFNMLNHSINRLLEFSELALDITSLKLQKYRIKYSQSKAKEKISSPIKYYEEIILAKNLTINTKSIDKDIFLCGDNDLIKKAFHIIIGNAIKHTKPNSTVIISYKKSKTNHIFTINDEGLGFPEELLKGGAKLFSIGKKHSDLITGLNLSFANLILIAHNGKLKLSNNKSGGGSVDIYFPIIPLECK